MFHLFMLSRRKKKHLKHLPIVHLSYSSGHLWHVTVRWERKTRR